MKILSLAIVVSLLVGSFAYGMDTSLSVCAEDGRTNKSDQELSSQEDGSNTAMQRQRSAEALKKA